MDPSSETERMQMRQKPYREFIIELIYLANATRLDICCQFIKSVLCWSRRGLHWQLAKRVLKYLKGTAHYKITYKRRREPDCIQIQIGQETDDRKSCTGNMLILARDSVSWRSTKQTSVVLSTIEAKYAALAKVSKEVTYIKRHLLHMGNYAKVLIIIFCDNQSVIELTKNAISYK